eukprot:8649764-Ditylum_brightwellii.AAC.1
MKHGPGENYCVKECSDPALSGLGVGAVVMLLKNYMPELSIVNGSIGTLDFAIDGPHTSGAKEDLKKIGVGQTTNGCLGFIDRCLDGRKHRNDVLRNVVLVPICSEEARENLGSWAPD